jgi:hypothetical protein
MTKSQVVSAHRSGMTVLLTDPQVPRSAMAWRNAALGSIATTCSPSRHAGDQAVDHALAPALPRPSTTPSTLWESASTRVVNHGSYRHHFAVSGVAEEPHLPVPVLIVAQVPHRLGVRPAIAAAAVMITACTVHQATPNDAATSRTARPAQATASNTATFSRVVHRARAQGGTGDNGLLFGVDSNARQCSG